MKKIIFPFYNKSKHGFLFTKWWFRATFVLYIIILLYSVSAVWIFQIEECRDKISAYELLRKEYSIKRTTAESPTFEALKQKSVSVSQKSETDQQYASYYWSAFLSATAYTLFVLIAHYFFQLIFFKIVVDFVVLGGKRGNSSSFGQ
jgi:hypothetical protein